MTTLILSKFEVAERQLHTAITLFFNDADPVSVHALAESSSQVLYDIREKFGAISLARDNDRIRPERKKEWLQALFKSRNFFKHADRDKDEVHEFNVETNHFSIFDAMCLFVFIKKNRTPETLLFEIWFALKYPDLLLSGPYQDAMLSITENTPGLSADDLLYFSNTLAKLREGKAVLPHFTLESGLPKN